MAKTDQPIKPTQVKTGAIPAPQPHIAGMTAHEKDSNIDEIVHESGIPDAEETLNDLDTDPENDTPGPDEGIEQDRGLTKKIASGEEGGAIGSYDTGNGGPDHPVPSLVSHPEAGEREDGGDGSDSPDAGADLKQVGGPDPFRHWE